MNINVNRRNVNNIGKIIIQALVINSSNFNRFNVERKKHTNKRIHIKNH